MTERRLHPRLDLPLQVELVVAGQERRATLENLSAGGATLRFPEQLAPGSVIEKLRFNLPNEGNGEPREIVAAATVERVEPLPQMAGEGGFSISLSFEELPPATFQVIQQFIFDRITRGSPQVEEMPLERRRVVLQRSVAMEFDRFDEFVAEVSENISMGGMFLRTSDPKPPGSEFSFQLRLGEDFSLIEGRAEVIWTREKSLGPERPAGMGVRFLELDDASRRTVRKLIEDAAAAERLEKPASGRVRVAAVFPKSVPVLKTEAGVSAQPPQDVESPALSAEVDKLRRELARRTRTYEEKIEVLSARIVELGAAQRESGESAESMAELEHERDELKARLSVADAELKELREEAKSVRDEIARERRARSGLDNRLRAVEQALRHTESERDRLQQKVKEVGQARDDLASRLGEGEEQSAFVAVEQYEGLQRTLADEKAAREELAGRLAALSEKNSELTAQLARSTERMSGLKALEADHMELTTRFEALEVEHSNLEILLTGATSDRVELEQETARLREEEKNRRQRAAAEEAERQELQVALERARSEVEEAHADGMRLAGELRGQLDALKAEERALGEQVARLEEEREDLERELAASRESDTAHRRKAEELEGQVAELRKALEAADEAQERRVGRLEWLVSETKEERAGLGQKLVELDQERGELENRLRAQAQSVESQRLLVQEAGAEKRELEELLQAVRAEAEAQGEERDALAARVAELEEEADRAAAREEAREEDREELLQQIARLESESDVGRKEQEALRAQLEHLQANSAASEKVSEELRREVSLLEVEAEELRRQNQILETQARSAEEDLDEQMAGARRREQELSQQRDQAVEAADARRREAESLQSELASERQQRVALAADLEAGTQTRHQLEEEVGTLQAAVRALTAAAEGEAVSAAPVAVAQAREREVPSRVLRRVAGIVGVGALLAALSWGGWRLVSRTESPTVGLPEREVAEAPASGAVEDSALGAAEDAGARRATPGAQIEGESLDSGDMMLGAEPAVPESAPPPRPAPEETVRAWAAAWSAQDVEGYLGFYATDFETPTGAAREAWEAFRRERLESPPWIRVTVGEIATEVTEGDRVIATFRQEYAAGAYSDVVEKTLVLGWEGNGWRILEERSTPL